MSSDYEKRLEAEIHHALKGLPELTAPRSLALRVMASLEQRFEKPWYRQAWQMWPIGLRVVSMVVLIGLFGGFCFASWKLSHLQTFEMARQRPMIWFSELSGIWHVFAVLGNATVLAVKQLGTGVLIAWIVALGLGCAMCGGVGTVYLKLAMARR